MHAMGVSGERLKAFIERIERLELEKENIATDIKEIYAEAKSHGFDTKIMKQVIKLRKMDKAKLEEQELLIETYLEAIESTIPAKVMAD